MSKPMHLCNHPGCEQLIPYDQRYCKQHQYSKPIDYADSKERHYANQRTYQRRIHSKHEGKQQRFYRSAAWKKLSHQWLMTHPLCVRCQDQGIYRKADVVDHVVELRDDWSRRLDTSNLQSLCYACHNRKTAIEKAKRKKKIKRRSCGR